VTHERPLFWIIANPEIRRVTPDGKIPLKDLQDIYDLAYTTQMIPIPVPVAKVMDYSLTDEVLKERK
jgi:hypothetical protein